jgi:hypothetical protein
LILYLDTSLLVTGLTLEQNTRAVQIWMADRASDAFAISDWVIAEFSSALSVKLRVGDITPQHRAEALAQFGRLIDRNFTTLPVSAAHFRNAARFADNYAVALRAGDALHLAICAAHGITLCTRDRPLARAGEKLGVKTSLI